ncbi:MAG: enterobactin-iron receptor [Lactobacillus crispatus]|jgi:hypothetical protein|nr:enterobactin-iron receptor [Lactobacillus crispatus]
MALTINGKKVLGYALGENEFLSGGNLNAFYIDATQYEDVTQYESNADHNAAPSFTIDMTNYFKEADTKHPDVQYYQIMTILDYEDNDGSSFRTDLITPLLKRGEINNKRSVAAGNGQATTAWFTDKNTLAISKKSMYDEDGYRFTGWFAYVYGFTSQDVGSVL